MSKVPGAEVGPWVEFTIKKNATAVQRLLVPWLIAKYGLAYKKTAKLPIVKEMLLALAPELPFLSFDVKVMAEEYPFGLTEIAMKAKVAAGTYAYIRFFVIRCSDCMPCFADKAVGKHRADIRDVLIQMFERPVPESDTVSRVVLSRVLGRDDLIWANPLLDVSTNRHLSALARQGVPSIVWETKERKSANARTVLDPITTAGQEILLDFLGMYKYIPVCNFYGL